MTVAPVEVRDVPVEIKAPVDLRPLTQAAVGAKAIGYLSSARDIAKARYDFAHASGQVFVDEPSTATSPSSGWQVQFLLALPRAQSALRLSTEAYRAGATNDLDVTTAQQQARDADLSAVIAEDAVRQARLDLLSAIGQSQ